MTQERAEAGLVLLREAAAIAYARLAGRQAGHCADSILDAVATALATCLPLYTGEPARLLSDAELACGSFGRGASVVRRSDGTIAFDCLRIERAALDAAIARLQRAGVRFSQVRPDFAPRRLPRVMPA